MRIDPTYLDELYFLAEQLQDNDYFEQNAKKFITTYNRLKRAMARHTDDPVIHRHLGQLPEIELQPYRRSLLEQLLPSGQRDMVGKSKSRAIIRRQVQEALGGLERIQDLLNGEEYV
jgi:hypothetical protein